MNQKSSIFFILLLLLIIGLSSLLFIGYPFFILIQSVIKYKYGLIEALLPSITSSLWTALFFLITILPLCLFVSLSIKLFFKPNGWNQIIVRKTLFGLTLFPEIFYLLTFIFFTSIYIRYFSLDLQAVIHSILFSCISLLLIIFPLIVRMFLEVFNKDDILTQDLIYNFAHSDNKVRDLLLNILPAISSHIMLIFIRGLIFIFTLSVLFFVYISANDSSFLNMKIPSSFSGDGIQIPRQICLLSSKYITNGEMIYYDKSISLIFILMFISFILYLLDCKLKNRIAYKKKKSLKLVKFSFY